MLSVLNIEIHQTLKGDVFLKDNRTQIAVEISKRDLEDALEVLLYNAKKKQEDNYKGFGRPSREWLKSSSEI